MGKIASEGLFTCKVCMQSLQQAAGFCLPLPPMCFILRILGIGIDKVGYVCHLYPRINVCGR